MSDDNKEISVIGKLKKYVIILIPIIVLVSVCWGVFKYITKKKNGEESTVGESVKEGVTLFKRVLKAFNE